MEDLPHFYIKEPTFSAAKSKEEAQKITFKKQKNDHCAHLRNSVNFKVKTETKDHSI